MKCYIHGYYSSFEEECPKCLAIGQKVIECEIDKIGRAISTMNEQGYSLLQASDGSIAFLVFKKQQAE